MNFSPDYRQILMWLESGRTYREVAKFSNLTRRAIWKHMKRSPEFRHALIDAREKGKKSRRYTLWLQHPFRGKRPPTGKGHGGKPRFSYGQR